MITGLSRRSFLKTTLASAGGLAAGCAHSTPARRPANVPLRVAVIGCGVRGSSAHIPAACTERLVAVVDADEKNIAKALKRAQEADSKTNPSNIRTFTDYRKLFEVMGKELDAVIIATPNHHHVLPALLAMQHGLHVYLEKPLAHDISEVRTLAATARQYHVATQMGNQGHSGESCRRLCEYLWAGAIGNVREVYCWSNRANGGIGGRPPSKPVPAGLHWDSWIGPAPYRDFHEDLHPHEWHSWWDFGNSSLGNMGCHILDAAFWALKLQHPTVIAVEDLAGGSNERYPLGTRLYWDFPARGDLAPVRVYWYDGLRSGMKLAGHDLTDDNDTVIPAARNRPPLVDELEKKYKRDLGGNGTIYIGDKGVMYTGTYGDSMRILPEERHKAFPMPAAVLPRIKGSHQSDFFRACRGGAPACSNFEYAAPLAELVLLGNLATRAGVGRKVEWDGPNMRCTNLPELNQYLQRPYREGWRA